MKHITTACAEASPRVWHPSGFPAPTHTQAPRLVFFSSPGAHVRQHAKHPGTPDHAQTAMPEIKTSNREQNRIKFLPVCITWCRVIAYSCCIINPAYKQALRLPAQPFSLDLENAWRNAIVPCAAAPDEICSTKNQKWPAPGSGKSAFYPGVRDGEFFHHLRFCQLKKQKKQQ